jgi:hypothetical protein
MKMKFVLLITLLALVLAACAPVASFMGPLPQEGQLLILTLVTAGVTWVLLKLSMVFKLDLSGYANMIAAALAPILVTLIETYLKLIPPVFDNVVLTIIHLIVLLVGSLGVFWISQRKPAPSLR